MKIKKDNCKSRTNGNNNNVRIRRSKANARERNRMHGLNAALDRLRRYFDFFYYLLDFIKIFFKPRAYSTNSYRFTFGTTKAI